MPAHHLTSRSWHQYNIVFAGQETGEHVAARFLLPALDAGQAGGTMDRWWYIRKQPAWRFRYLAPSGPGLGELLDQLAVRREITSWTPGIYEPETTAFGGPQGMRAAHLLFHHDSRHLLTSATGQAAPRPGRRETSVLLCAALLRAAGLDWYEQADVWAKVAALRAGAGSLPAGRKAQLTPAMHRLLTVSTGALRHSADRLADDPDEWVTAFEQAGKTLASLAAAGRLRRGLRAVLAHHILFHANRAGLPVRDQSILAALAASTMFETTPGAVFLPGARPADS